MIRVALVVALSALAVFPAFAVDVPPPTVQPPGGIQHPNATAFAQAPNIEDAIRAKVTGIYRAVTVTNNRGAKFETLVLLHQGQVQEVHTRKQTGAYFQKRSGQSIKPMSTTAFNNLIQTAGGLGRNVETNPTLKAQFYQAAELSTGSTPSPSPLPPCPSDYRTMTPLQKQKVQTDPRYRACLSLYERGLLHYAAARGQFQPVRIEILYFSIMVDNLFRPWGFEMNTGGVEGAYAFNGFGITAIWQTYPDSPHP
jgi:hypothetical protein